MRAPQKMKNGTNLWSSNSTSGSLFTENENTGVRRDVCAVLSRSVVSDSLQPHGLLPSKLLCPWILQARKLDWLPFPPSGNLPIPGIEARSPTLQADSLPSEPPGKPKNAGMGSLSLLQGIFLTLKSNWSLLHCRWILYQLSYQGTQ